MALTLLVGEISLVGKALANVERLGVRRLHGDSFGRINKHRHLEEVSFLDQVFSDTDIFADPARYFAKATRSVEFYKIETN